MKVDAQAVLTRRRREREQYLSRAREFADRIDASVDVRAVCVFGSVARGDFNLWSDVDVLVIAAQLPDHPVARLEALGTAEPRVQPVVWTPAEWHRHLDRRDPIAVECATRGVWLFGSG